MRNGASTAKESSGGAQAQPQEGRLKGHIPAPAASHRIPDSRLSQWLQHEKTEWPGAQKGALKCKTDPNTHSAWGATQASKGRVGPRGRGV